MAVAPDDEPNDVVRLHDHDEDVEETESLVLPLEFESLPIGIEYLLPGLKDLPRPLYVILLHWGDPLPHSRSRKPNRYKSALCNAYMQRTVCQFDNTCWYAHGEREQRPRGQESPTRSRALRKRNTYKLWLCNAFIQDGDCEFGDRCRYAHGEEELRLPPLDFQESQSLSYSERFVKNFCGDYKSAQKQNPNSCGDYKDAQKQNPKTYKISLCHEFQRKKSCKRGDQCPYAHGVADLRPPPRTVEQMHPKYRTKLCDKFSMFGYCPYGARCTFVHMTKMGLPLLKYEQLVRAGRVERAPGDGHVLRTRADSWFRRRGNVSHEDEHQDWRQMLFGNSMAGCEFNGEEKPHAEGGNKCGY